MLPSSSSQLARYGQINHYKKFWLLQTQLEKQEQSSTSLSLGVTGNTNVKESKPLVSSTSLIANGDHLINNNNIPGHGSCRVDMVTCSASSSRAGAFPYCSNEPGSLRFYTSNLEYTHVSNGSLRDSPALSLAVNCESVAHPVSFLNQTWSPSSLSPASKLHLPNLAPTHTCIPEQVKVSPVVEECESSECSNGGGEKRGLLWDNASTSQSTSSISFSSKQRHELAGPQCNPPGSIISTSLHEAAVLPSPSRSGHGGTGPLRTCTLCGTTKTPLWRGGPDGPKSLCNACGIRVKKTKRLQAAMEAAGVAAEGVVSSASSPASAYKRLLSTTKKAAGRPGTLKRKISMEAAENQNDPIFQMNEKKKKAAGVRRSSCCSWPPPNVAESCNLDSGTCYRVFGDASANLAAGLVVDSSKNFSSNLFAQDVEEAAVLLMALSCGLVLS